MKGKEGKTGIEKGGLFRLNWQELGKGEGGGGGGAESPGRDARKESGREASAGTGRRLKVKREKEIGKEVVREKRGGEGGEVRIG